MAVRFARLNLRCIRGTRWDDNITLVDETTSDPIDVSDVVEILLRARDDSGAVVIELRLTEDTLVFVTDGADGQLGIRAASALTNTLPTAGNEIEAYSYDLQLERTAGEWEAGTRGTLTVEPTIGRPLDDA